MGQGDRIEAVPHLLKHRLKVRNGRVGDRAISQRS